MKKLICLLISSVFIGGCAESTHNENNIITMSVSQLDSYIRKKYPSCSVQLMPPTSYDEYRHHYSQQWLIKNTNNEIFIIYRDRHGQLLNAKMF